MYEFFIENMEVYEINCFLNSFFVPGSIIICDNGHHAVIQPEYGHKDDTVQFKIHTEYSRRRIHTSAKVQKDAA